MTKINDNDMKVMTNWRIYNSWQRLVLTYWHIEFINGFQMIYEFWLSHLKRPSIGTFRIMTTLAIIYESHCIIRAYLLVFHCHCVSISYADSMTSFWNNLTLKIRPLLLLTAGLKKTNQKLSRLPAGFNAFNAFRDLKMH